MNREAQPDKSMQSVVVECELTEPPEKVWRALTVPDLLAAWLMPNDMRPEIGRRFRFRDRPDADASGAGAGEAGANIECEVLAAEPPRLLAISWRAADHRQAGAPALDSVVTFVLTRTAAGGTHLRLVHDGFAGLRQPVMRLAGMVRATLSRSPARPRHAWRPASVPARSLRRPMMRWAA